MESRLKFNSTLVVRSRKMLQTVEIVSILLVALAMAPALAHLLEFPGKSRLTKDAYLTVQPIYYPGFKRRWHRRNRWTHLHSCDSAPHATSTPAFWLRLM